MPDAKDNSKMNSQDPRARQADDPPDADEKRRAESDEATPGLGINQAGFIKDKDSDATNGPGSQSA